VDTSRVAPWSYCVKIILSFDFKDGRGRREWSLVGTVMDVGGGGRGG